MESYCNRSGAGPAVAVVCWAGSLKSLENFIARLEARAMRTMERKVVKTQYFPVIAF